jgi:hypothetical protein
MSQIDLQRWKSCTGGTIRKNIQISAKESLGYFELKKHNLWFKEGCSKVLDQKEQAKLQLLQDPSYLLCSFIHYTCLHILLFLQTLQRLFSAPILLF